MYRAWAATGLGDRPPPGPHRGPRLRRGVRGCHKPRRPGPSSTVAMRRAAGGGQCLSPPSARASAGLPSFNRLRASQWAASGAIVRRQSGPCQAASGFGMVAGQVVALAAQQIGRGAKTRLGKLARQTGIQYGRCFAIVFQLGQRGRPGAWWRSRPRQNPAGRPRRRTSRQRPDIPGGRRAFRHAA